jgi:hypothetical protein
MHERPDTDEAPIVPDTKDWTWVLERPCPECGFDASGVRRDEVMLTSGVFGTVRGLDEGVAQVEIADGVTVKVARGAVGQVVREESTPDEAAPDDEPEVPEEN